MKKIMVFSLVLGSSVALWAMDDGCRLPELLNLDFLDDDAHFEKNREVSSPQKHLDSQEAVEFWERNVKVQQKQDEVSRQVQAEVESKAVQENNNEDLRGHEVQVSEEQNFDEKPCSPELFQAALNVLYQAGREDRQRREIAQQRRRQKAEVRASRIRMNALMQCSIERARRARYFVPIQPALALDQNWHFAWQQRQLMMTQSAQNYPYIPFPQPVRPTLVLNPYYYVPRMYAPQPFMNQISQ